MGRVFSELDDGLRQWIGGQHVFFVATAPDGPDGHINLSPKGAMDSFQVLGPTTVAYLDMMGSGIETVAHLRQNGRIVVMFCAFTGPPKIVRLHGRGRVVHPQDNEFVSLLAEFAVSDDVRAITRAIVVVEITRIADSCGYTVPRMEYVEDRDQLFRWADRNHDKRGPEWAQTYVCEKNAASVDGLDGLRLRD